MGFFSLAVACVTENVLCWTKKEKSSILRAENNACYTREESYRDKLRLIYMCDFKVQFRIKLAHFRE
jgi:hypothetical protein